MVKAALAKLIWKQNWTGEWEQIRQEVHGRYRAPRESGRVGTSGRTFHARVQSIGKHTGGVAKAIRGLGYDKREGKYTQRADELEVSGGRSTDEMTEILKAVDQAVTRKNGQLALDYEIELPHVMTRQARQQVAEQIAAWFEDRGVPCHWAVHSHNDRGELQPHLHMTTTSRAVRRHLDGGREAPDSDGVGGWEVVTRGATVIGGPAMMQHFRREVLARTINQVAAEHGIDLGTTWHGGRLEETGIDRPAKRRRPMLAIKREAAATADDRGLAAINAAIDRGDYGVVIDARRQFVERQQQAQQDQAAERAERALQKSSADLIALGQQRHPNRDPNAPAEHSPDASVPEKPARKSAERPFRLATEGQRRMILKMAAEAGVTVPDSALDRLDGGEVIAAVKVAKAARSALRSRDKVLAVFEQALGQADQRLMEVERRAAVAEREVTALTGLVADYRAVNQDLVAELERFQKPLPAEAIKVVIETQEVGPPITMPPLPSAPVSGMPEKATVVRSFRVPKGGMFGGTEVKSWRIDITAEAQQAWQAGEVAGYARGMHDRDKMIDYLQENLSRAERIGHAGGRRDGSTEMRQQLLDACEQVGWMPVGLWREAQEQAVQTAERRRLEAEAAARDAQATAAEALESTNAKAVRRAKADLKTAQGTVTTLTAEVERLRPIAEEPSKAIAVAQDETRQARAETTAARAATAAAEQARTAAEVAKDQAVAAREAAEQIVRDRPVREVVKVQTRTVEVAYTDRWDKSWSTATLAAKSYEEAYSQQWAERVKAEDNLKALQQRWDREAEPAITLMLKIAAKTPLQPRTAASDRSPRKDGGNSL
jgi:hypothetical protein